MKLSGELQGKEDSKIFKGTLSVDVKNKTQMALEVAAIIVEGQAKMLSPVDTGRLRASITHRINGGVAEVGTNVEYAAHVEYGTRYMPAQSYLRTAVDLTKQNVIIAFHKAIKEALGGE